MSRRRRKSRPRRSRWKFRFGLFLVFVVAATVVYVATTTPEQRKTQMARVEQVAEEVTGRVRGWVEERGGSDTGTYGQTWEIDDSITYGGIPEASGYPHSIAVLPNTGFVVGYCEWKKNPVWVAYRVHDVPPGPAPPRPSRFQVDPRTRSRVTHDSYTHSGYDRGHLAPNFAIATRYGPEAQEETFLMSNISPQSPALNRQVWEGLERRIAREYSATYGDVWVFVGPVFDRPSPRLRSGVAIPAAFWKVVIVQDRKGNPYSLAFLIPQEVRGHEDPSIFLTSIDAIEEATGLDLFHALPDALETVFEASIAPALW